MEEARRQAVLDGYQILDTPAEPAFDAITNTIARMLDVPIALVSLVDTDRQWSKSCVGIDVRETPRNVAFCAYAIASDDVLVVPDTASDPRFTEHPLVRGAPHVRSYAGAPLIGEAGARLGTLCVLDRRPREFSRDEQASLRDLAVVIVELMDRRLAARARHILARVAEVSPNAAFVYDVQRRSIEWGEAALTRLFGADPEHWRELVHPDDLPHLANIFTASDTVDVVPFRLRARDGGPERSLVTRRTVFERDDRGEVKTMVGVTMDVTELTLTDRRLIESEHALAERVLVLEGIVESADTGILFADSTGQLQLANTKARRLRDESRATVAGEELIAHAGIFEEDGKTPITPERLPLNRALGGEIVEMQRVFIRNTHYPQGAHIQARARPIRDAQGTLRGAVATLADVTAIQLARQRIAGALTNLTAIIDALPIGLFVRHDHASIYANAALAQILERDLATIVGVPAAELIAPSDRALVEAHLARLHDGAGIAPIELQLQGSRGPVTVEAHGLQIDYDGHDAILMICRDVRAEKEARAQLDASLREKEALLKEIHHRVKNNLSVISSMLFIQSRSSRDPVLRGALEESMARVRSIGLVHEQLYRTKDFGHVELGAYLATLIREITSTLGTGERGVEIDLRATPVTIALDQAVPCALIVNELLTNAAKHAYPHGRGSVRVEVRDDQGRVKLTVADDGVGFDPAARSKTTIGLELIDELCEQLDANRQIDTSRGTVFSFSFARKS